MSIHTCNFHFLKIVTQVYFTWMYATRSIKCVLHQQCQGAWGRVALWRYGRIQVPGTVCDGPSEKHSFATYMCPFPVLPDISVETAASPQSELSVGFRLCPWLLGYIRSIISAVTLHPTRAGLNITYTVLYCIKTIPLCNSKWVKWVRENECLFYYSGRRNSYILSTQLSRGCMTQITRIIFAKLIAEKK